MYIVKIVGDILPIKYSDQLTSKHKSFQDLGRTEHVSSYVTTKFECKPICTVFEYPMQLLIMISTILPISSGTVSIIL